MNSLDAFARGEAARAAGNKMKFFDWDKAAKLLAERGDADAEAGLAGDWEYTGGPILTDGKPTPEDETYVYLCSNWATPMLRFSNGEEVECYVMETEEIADNWDERDYWPDSAREIYTKETA